MTNLENSKPYIARELPGFMVLGVPFQAFIDELGDEVFSEASVERGFGIATGGLNKIRKTRAYQKKYGTKVCQDVQTKAGQGVEVLEGAGRQGGENAPRRLRTVVNSRPIRVITKAELTWLVSYLAFERGHERALAMQDASFATLLQQTCDNYRNNDRPLETYLDAAADLREKLQKEWREKLQKTSGMWTNPLLACNTYVPNNELVFGMGQSRDTYEGDDKAFRLQLATNLEMFQCGLKAAGLSMTEVLEKSHDFVRNHVKMNAF